MGKKQKKNVKGEVSLYITRTKAVRKLGLTLKDFRRLCILKGIYPREPNKKFEGNNKTYYAKKDINFLAHDKILSTLLEIKIHIKKAKRAQTLNDPKKAEGFLQRKPKLELTHIVKERYPSFIDAIRDLDDPLCLVNLFGSLPSHRLFKIPPTKVQLCQKLQREFNFYCMKAGCLRKVFLSIKGIYFQAEIEGQNVLWVQPFEFSQTLPYDVDYRVMSTFLDFYETLMKFVLFKLYGNLNMSYPPSV
jgi:pescadillo protein